MAILKCKMCGGDIELSSDKTFGTCDHCGSTMTFPKVDDEQRANLFNRGNHFRRMGEFDKALAVYERIAEENEYDAEAHWCCALCRFGIEYVEDPNSFEYLPTCHRASFDSFLEDVDYLAAIEHSDGVTRRQYQKDASKIAEVQRGILATSKNEEPFDVFICYKESEADGSRTRDSLLAQDIYYHLTEQGHRVFFSRITLEDKVGTEYEPYIFAALNSAKVMIVVTTSPEHANAVWVKNEWSRFLSLMRKDRTKLLLPCYRDMDPYDLPEALSILQSYDMQKIGFLQDLIHGVNKVLDVPKLKESAKETVVIQQANANIAPLLKRVFMFLEDGEWESANDYAEKVLDIDPENGEAYLSKAMRDLRIRTRNGLNDAPGIERDINIQKALRYGSDSLKNEINGYIISTSAAEEKRKKAIEEEALKKQAEKERKAIEEEATAQAEAHKVVSAIMAKQSGKEAPSLEQQLAVAKQKVDDLEKICDNFEKESEHINQLNLEKAEATNKLSSLRSKRNSLGLFAGKERKLLDNEISDTLEMIKQIDFKLSSAYGHLYNFTSKAAADEALANAKSDFSFLKTKLDEAEKTGSIEFSYIKAIQTLISKPRVKQIINEKYPDLVSKSHGFMTILFGRYPESPKNEITEIEWLVLKVEENKALLISRYAFDRRQYNASVTSVTWETCSIRKWLNETFISSTFSSDEQALILNATVTADKNPSHNTFSGNNTTDKIFLLSIPEAKQYFRSDSARQCKVIEYSSQGANKISNGNCWWWLRSPGDRSGSAALVSPIGVVSNLGTSVAFDTGAVRPAMWISIESMTDELSSEAARNDTTVQRNDNE